MGLKEYNQQHLANSKSTNRHFLKRNPDLHRVFIESMKVMSEHNINDVVATRYLIENEPILKGKSINTVRRYFKDIRDGVI